MNKLIPSIIMVFCLSGCSRFSEPYREPYRDDYREPYRDDYSIRSKYELLNEHNRIRSRFGIRELKMVRDLEEQAQKQAEYMARRRTLTHSTERELRGLRYNTVGENILQGNLSEQQAVDRWINSRRHRENILQIRFEYVGFGFARSSDNQIYWCVVFAGEQSRNQNTTEKPNG